MSPVLRDRLAALLALAFVVSLWVQRDYTTPFGGLFPDIVMVAVAAIALVALALSFTRFAPSKKEEGEKASPAWGQMAVVGGLLLAWAVALRYLGFAVCGVVGFAGIAWFLAERRRDPKVIVSSIVVGAAVTAAIVVVFGKLLEVPLPQGLFFE